MHNLKSGKAGKVCYSNWKEWCCTFCIVTDFFLWMCVSLIYTVIDTAVWKSSWVSRLRSSNQQARIGLLTSISLPQHPTANQQHQFLVKLLKVTVFISTRKSEAKGKLWETFSPENQTRYTLCTANIVECFDSLLIDDRFISFHLTLIRFVFFFLVSNRRRR